MGTIRSPFVLLRWSHSVVWCSSRISTEPVPAATRSSQIARWRVGTGPPSSYARLANIGPPYSYARLATTCPPDGYPELATTLVLVVAADSAVTDSAALVLRDARRLRPPDCAASRESSGLLGWASSCLPLRQRPCMRRSEDRPSRRFRRSQSASSSRSRSRRAQWWPAGGGFASRDGGRGQAINRLGAALSGAVALTAAVTKFTAGAWVVVLLIPLIVEFWLRVHGHYARARAVSPRLSQRPQASGAVPPTPQGTRRASPSARTSGLRSAISSSCPSRAGPGRAARTGLPGVGGRAHICPSWQEDERFRCHWKVWGEHLPIQAVLSRLAPRSLPWSTTSRRCTAAPGHHADRGGPGGGPQAPLGATAAPIEAASGCAGC